MKKAIISFKQRSKSLIGCAGVYYKEIPKILVRFYFRKLAKRGCWDIKIIDIEDIAKDKAKNLDELYIISSEDINNHIPRID